jgi:uncharacterized coiled-coil protein SlyX
LPPRKFFLFQGKPYPERQSAVRYLPNRISDLQSIYSGMQVALYKKKSYLPELTMSQQLPVRPSHVGIIASLLLVVAALGYAWHEHGVSTQLSAQNAQISTTLDQTRNQMDALNSRLNQLSEAEAQKQAAAAEKQSAAHPAVPHSNHKSAHATVRRDDPRFHRVDA